MFKISEKEARKALKEFKRRPVKLPDGREFALYYKRYRCLDVTYEQLELTGNEEMRIVEMLSELGGKDVQSIADLFEMNIFGFIQSAGKNGYLWEWLSIVLRKVEYAGNGQTFEDGSTERLVAITPEEFSPLPISIYGPLVQEVATDFFYMKYALFSPLINALKKAFNVADIIAQAAAVGKNTIPFAEETSRTGQPSKPSPAVGGSSGSKSGTSTSSGKTAKPKN